MQSFLPYSDFKKSAQVLDYKRLGKQRVEALQIYNCLMNPNRWKNHPCIKMWNGYMGALAEYHNIMIEEWIKRGYVNNMSYILCQEPYDYPWWLGDENFHRAMRSRLIEKDEKYYLPLFPNDKGFNDSKYLWPLNDSKSFKII